MGVISLKGNIRFMLVAAVFVATIFSAAIPASTVYAAGEIGINTIEDLDSMRDDLSGEYRLMRDLDFEDCDSYANCSNMSDFTTGVGWVPVGNTTNRFTGYFNGDDYIISNLYIHDQTDNDTGIGLFGAINNARVTGFTLENPVVNASGNSSGVGAAIGRMTGGESSADYIHVRGGSVSASSTQVGGIVGASAAGIGFSSSSASVQGNSQIGGVTGYNLAGGTVYNSYSNSVVGRNDNSSTVAGGITGVNAGIIQNSYAAGWTKGSVHIGGLVGINIGQIQISFALGSVSGANNNVGGLVGTNEDGTIQETYAAACVTSQSASYIGGLVGRDIAESVSDSFYDQEISLKSDTGKGTSRTTTQMKATSTFTDLGGWGVNEDGDAWLQYPEDNHGYPYLDDVYMIEFDIANCGGTLPEDNDGNNGNNGGGNTPDPTPTVPSDANDDGIDDSEQPNVAAFVSPVSGKTVAIALGDECELNSNDIVKESTFAAQDSSYDYDDGFFDFAADCQTDSTTVKLYYYGISKNGLRLRKHNPNNNTYFDIPNATLTEQTLGGQKVTVASYTITDGGELDMDGEQNGQIVDPAGLGHVLGASSNLGNTGTDAKALTIIASILLATTSLAILHRKYAHLFVK